MNIKSFAANSFVVLALALSLSITLPIDAKVTSNGSSTNSSPAFTSSPSTNNSSNNSIRTPAPIQTQNNTRVDNTAGKVGTQSTMQINSGAKHITQPVNASYKPQVVNTQKPTTGAVFERSYIAPNPNNVPVQRQYVTRYDRSGTPFSLQVVLPVGANVNSYSSYYDDRFPVNVSSGYRTVMTPSTTIVDNTPTNGWDFGIFFLVFGGVILIIIVFAVIGSRA